MPPLRSRVDSESAYFAYRWRHRPAPRPLAFDLLTSPRLTTTTTTMADYMLVFLPQKKIDYGQPICHFHLLLVVCTQLYVHALLLLLCFWWISSTTYRPGTWTTACWVVLRVDMASNVDFPVWPGCSMRHTNAFSGVTDFSIQKSQKWSLSCFPKKGQFRVYKWLKHTEKAQFEKKNMWTVSWVFFRGAEKTKRGELEDDMHVTCFFSLCSAEHSTPRTTIPKWEVSSLHTRNCKDGLQLCRRCVHDHTQQLINPRFPQTVKPPRQPESQQTREFSDHLCATTAAARSPTPPEEVASQSYQVFVLFLKTLSTRNFLPRTEDFWEESADGGRKRKLSVNADAKTFIWITPNITGSNSAASSFLHTHTHTHTHTH